MFPAFFLHEIIVKGLLTAGNVNKINVQFSSKVQVGLQEKFFNNFNLQTA